MKEFLKIIIMAVTPIIIAIFVFLVVLGGMSLFIKGTTVEEIEKEKDRFEIIQEWKGRNFTFYDKTTKVQYYYIQGGITVLVDADGKPLLYKED